LLLARPVVAPPQLALAHFGHLPLFFEPNFGQADKELRFLARGAACVLGLADRQAIIRLRPRHGRHSSLLRMHLVGAAQPAAIEGAEPTGGVSSYFVGRTPEKWRTGIRQYASVEYRRIYPGIDLIFHARQGALEFDFQVTPGADPGLIRMRWEGVDSVKVGHAGELVLAAEAAELRLRRPRVFQQVGDRRVELEGRYVVRGAREVRFALARHDTTAPLLIDPVLSYSTFLGGSGDDFAARLAVDSTGNAYVTGQTSSLDFPVSSGAVDTSANGWNDVFVTKLNPTGAAVLYSTYLGGSGDDSGSGIAVDPAGNAYVVGRTDSPNFPVTAGAFDTSANGSYDAFVAKLNATGTALLYSTFLGGSAFDAAHAIALDAAGNAYVSGATLSSNFPTTAGAYDTSPNGRSDAFVAKLSAAGSSLVYSTLLGGAGDDVAQDIALDSSGNAYVTGSTSSSDFPTTVGAYDTSFNGGSFPSDAFVAKLNPSGAALVFSTFLGSSGDDWGHRIAVDSAGNSYVAGATWSGSFPTVPPGAFDTSFNGAADGFIAKLNATGAALVYSTFLGGSDNDSVWGLAVDSAGNVFASGQTASADFPVTANAID